MDQRAGRVVLALRELGPASGGHRRVSGRQPDLSTLLADHLATFRPSCKPRAPCVTD
jgi:hypothetical protein